MIQSTNLLSTLESYLTLSTTRQQLIATNMANIDTPGYRSTDIDFEKEMHRATSEMSNSALLSPVISETRGLLERPDGNDVDIDRESLLLSQTQLQYQIGVQLLKHHFHGLLSAINGGS
jgi:flagellar basal-body rod protein FlgB